MILRVALVLVLSLVLGCTKKAALPLRVQLIHDPVSLDPALAEDGVSLLVLNNIFDGLVGYDSSGNLENRLAEKVQISEGGKKYEFTLRKNAFWSDHQPVTAEDFITAFRRILGPQSVSKLSTFFMPIRNAQSYHEGKVPAEKLGVYAESSNQKLVIELEKPVSYFLQTLTLPPALPERKDVLDLHQGTWPNEAPSTGSYFISSKRIGQKVVLSRNPFYWGGEPQFKEVEFLVVTDETTGLNLFQQGKLDLLLRIPFLDYPKLKQTGKVQTSPYLTTYYLSFNCKIPPFNNREWRKAVAGAIHRKEITTLLGSGEMAAWSWIPNGLEGYSPYRDPKETFSKSMTEIRNSSNKPAVIQASFDAGLRNLKIMEKVQQDLKIELGLNISLSELDWKTYIKNLGVQTPQIYRLGWMAPFRDPISHLKVFTTGSLNNLSGFSNAQYDSLVNEIETLSPGPIREGKIQQAQKILLEDEAAVVPIYHYVQNTGVSDRVKNFRANSLGLIRFQELRKDD